MPKTGGPTKLEGPMPAHPYQTLTRGCLVLALALAEPLVPIEWSEADDLASQPGAAGAPAAGTATTAH